MHDFWNSVCQVFNNWSSLWRSSRSPFSSSVRSKPSSCCTIVFTPHPLRALTGGSILLLRAWIEVGKSKIINSLNRNISPPTRLSSFWLAKCSSEPSKFKIFIFFLNTLAVSISVQTKVSKHFRCCKHFHDFFSRWRRNTLEILP